jgi:hypothetical protein
MRPWVLGTIFLVLIVAACLVVGWWRFGGGRQVLLSLPLQRWPDFAKWDQHNEFELDDAAALWFDAEPRSPMWWRARWKFRRLRAGIAAASRQQQSTAPIDAGIRPSAASRRQPPIHRDALKALAEREGVHPLFLYPGLRFRSRERDQETDRGRLASIRESVLSTISSAQNELGGLQARAERARQSAATLTTAGKDEEFGRNERASSEIRVLAPERRIEELKDHLAALRRIESAVNKELNL